MIVDCGYSNGSSMLWYYKLLARRPHLVLVAVGIFSVACIVVALCTRKLPDFDDPTLVSIIGERQSSVHGYCDGAFPPSIFCRASRHAVLRLASAGPRGAICWRKQACLGAWWRIRRS